jgi:anaerobic selenocysteine-containing dehydrogenase
MSKIYNYEDIFQEIPNDPDNIMMTIPPEICAEVGLTEGDVVNITVDNGRLVITKKD